MGRAEAQGLDRRRSDHRAVHEEDFFTYEPQFTLWVAGNHKPGFRGVDEAIRRRVLLVPFLQVIPEAERDLHLPEKLKAEWPAIFRWAIDGCLAWQREGLAHPPALGPPRRTTSMPKTRSASGSRSDASFRLRLVGRHSRAYTTTGAPGLSLEDCTPAHHKRSASASTSAASHAIGPTKGRAFTASNCVR